MAQPRTRTATKPAVEGQQVREPLPHPGVPRIMVSWNPPPTEGGERQEKTWHGITFTPGKAEPIEHMPELKWREMLRSIDASQGDGGWSYAYQVDEPPPPPQPEEPPPEPEPEEPPPDEPEANHRRKR